MTQPITTAYVRRQLAKRWHARDWHGIWFYGTWLFHRCYGFAILSIPITVLASILLIQHLTTH